MIHFHIFHSRYIRGRNEIRFKNDRKILHVHCYGYRVQTIIKPYYIIKHIHANANSVKEMRKQFIVLWITNCSINQLTLIGSLPTGNALNLNDRIWCKLVHSSQRIPLNSKKYISRKLSCSREKKNWNWIEFFSLKIANESSSSGVSLLVLFYQDHCDLNHNKWIKPQCANCGRDHVASSYESEFIKRELNKRASTESRSRGGSYLTQCGRNNSHDIPRMNHVLFQVLF